MEDRGQTTIFDRCTCMKLPLVPKTSTSAGRGTSDLEPEAAVGESAKADVKPPLTARHVFTNELS